MELYQLKYLLTLAEDRNFSRAADRLYITQSALSQQLKKLEKELGILLFERNTKTVEITSDGQVFLEYARKIYTEYENMQQWLSVRTSQVTDLLLGVSEYSANLVYSGIEAFRAHFPSVHVNLVIERPPALIDMVKYRTLDFAYVGIPENTAIRSGLSIFPVLNEHLCAIVSQDHPLHTCKDVTISDLAYEKIIMRSNTSRIYFEVLNAFKHFGFTPDISIVEDFDVQFSKIKEGAISFAKSNAYMYSNAHLIMLPITPIMNTEFSLITSEHRMISAIEQSFLADIRKSIIESKRDMEHSLLTNQSRPAAE